MRLAAVDPALALGIEGGALLLAEGGDALRLGIEKLLVVGQGQLAVFDPQRVATEREVAADAQ